MRRRIELGLLALLFSGASPAAVVTQTTLYECSASSGMVSMVMGGPYDFTVTARADLPASVPTGQTVSIAAPTLVLGMPAALVTRLRTGMSPNQKSVGGSAVADVLVNGHPVPVYGLEAAQQPLPPSGGMTLTTFGTIAAQPATTPGILRIEMPPTFTLNAKLDPGFWGLVKGSALECKARPEADRLLGVITVLPLDSAVR